MPAPLQTATQERGSSLRPGRVAHNTLQRVAYLTSLGPGDLFLDVGSGDGAACCMATLLTGCFSMGIEIVPSRYTQSACLLQRLRYELQLKVGVPKSQLPPLPPAAGGGPWPSRIGNIGRALESEASIHSLATVNVSTLLRALGCPTSFSSVLEADLEDFTGAGGSSVCPSYSARKLRFDLAKRSPQGGTHKLCLEAGFPHTNTEARHAVARLWLANVHRCLVCGLYPQVLPSSEQRRTQQIALAKRRCIVLNDQAPPLFARSRWRGASGGAGGASSAAGDSSDQSSAVEVDSSSASVSSQLPFGRLLHSASEQSDTVEILSDDDSDMEHVTATSSTAVAKPLQQGRTLSAGPTVHGRRGHRVASAELQRLDREAASRRLLSEAAACPAVLFLPRQSRSTGGQSDLDDIRARQASMVALLGPRAALPPPPDSGQGHPWMASRPDDEAAHATSKQGKQGGAGGASSTPKRQDLRLSNDSQVSRQTWAVFRAPGDTGVRDQQVDLTTTAVHSGRPAHGWGWLSDTDEEAVRGGLSTGTDCSSSPHVSPDKLPPIDSLFRRNKLAGSWLAWLKAKREHVRTQVVQEEQFHYGLHAPRAAQLTLPGLAFLGGCGTVQPPLGAKGGGSGGGTFGGTSSTAPIAQQAAQPASASHSKPSKLSGVASAVYSAVVGAARSLTGAPRPATPPTAAHSTPDEGHTDQQERGVSLDSHVPIASFPSVLYAGRGSVSKQKAIPPPAIQCATSTAGAGAALSIMSSDATDQHTPAMAVGSLDMHPVGSSQASPGASSDGDAVSSADGDSSDSSGGDSADEDASGRYHSSGVPPWRLQPVRGDAEWRFGWPHRSANPHTAAQLAQGMLPQLARQRLVQHPKAREFVERFGVVDLPEHEKVAFVCGDALNDDALGLSPQALGLARVVFVNNYDGLWQQDNFQNKVYLKLTRHMRQGSVLVSCTPFLPSRHSVCVLTDRGKEGEGRDVYTRANLSLMVHGGAPQEGWGGVDTALLWVQNSSGGYVPRTAAEKAAVKAALAAEEDAGGSGQLIDDAAQTCNAVWRAGVSSGVFRAIQCRLQGFLQGQLCEPWQHELGMSSATGVNLHSAQPSPRKRPRAK